MKKEPKLTGRLLEKTEDSWDVNSLLVTQVNFLWVVNETWGTFSCYTIYRFGLMQSSSHYSFSRREVQDSRFWIIRSSWMIEDNYWMKFLLETHDSLYRESLEWKWRQWLLHESSSSLSCLEVNREVCSSFKTCCLFHFCWKRSQYFHSSNVVGLTRIILFLSPPSFTLFDVKSKNSRKTFDIKSASRKHHLFVATRTSCSFSDHGSLWESSGQET